MTDYGTFYWFKCPACENSWGSQQEIPDREWCSCASELEPELVYEEQGQL